MFNPKLFYKTYLHDYHKYKSIMLMSVLKNLSESEKQFFSEPLEIEDSEAFAKTIKSELRQTYIHCIETFFELFFTLVSSSKSRQDDYNILFNLANSDWRKNYKEIEKIASGEISLDFLNEKIEFQGLTQRTGQYLFYYGINGMKTIPDFLEQVGESIEAIQHGIKILAKDFIDRDEYNSYKHGLRIIPALKELAVADPETMEIQLKWDLADSMSFFCKTKDSNEVKIKTKLFDTDRDFKLTRFCSNMISSMVFTRKVFFYNEEFVKKAEMVAIPFFGKRQIDDCETVNVEIQDIVFSIKKI